MINAKRFAASLLTLALLLLAAPAWALTFTVNDVNDVVDVNPGDGVCETFLGNGVCTLRAAIDEANWSLGNHTINIPAGTYTISLAGSEDDNLSGDFDINSNIAIVGAGSGATIISGGGIDRVFNIDPWGNGSTVSISGVTIRDGNAAAGGAGGGILIGDGTTLTVTDSTITGNTVNNNDAGGIYNIFNGTLIVTNSIISNNSMTGSGNGGGILNYGTATVTNSIISNNSTTGSGNGGGILNQGTATVTNSTISGNTAAADGGGIYSDGGSVAITNSTISNNSALAGSGGGIYSNGVPVDITNSTISGNAATDGGGIRVEGGGDVTLKNTIVANSTGGNCSNTASSITSGGNNIDDGTTCGWAALLGSMSSTNPNLGALTGSPAYFPLNTGSAAIDAGDNTVCAAAPVNNTSQNGVTRPSDGDGNATAICDIGSYEAPAPDTTPNAFSFTAQTGVALTTVATSNTITVSGINAAASISIVGGTYSINGGGYTAVAGTVNNGDTVTVRQTSSGSFSTLTTATLTIGGVSGAFDVTTLAIDTTPNAFSFTAQTGVALTTVATSSAITVSGINSASAISIVGGTYSINGGAYTSGAGTVSNGDSVTVRQTSSGSFTTLTTATLTIGGVVGAFDVTTLAIDTTPNAFSFTAQTGVALSTVATSNNITVSGINAAASISIVGGTYSINGGGYTAVAGTVNNGDTVTVRQTSSGSYSTMTTATLTIGGVSGAFDVTTFAAATTTYTGTSATGTGNVTASFTGGGAGCGYTTVQFIPLTGNPASPPAGTAPSGVTFPHGLFDFTTGGCTPGSTITMTITWPSALPAGTQYWKYGPTPTNAVPHWYVLPAAIAGNVTTFSITDGALGDDDLLANGIIVDQGGPGGGGGAGGAASVPTLSEWAMMALALLLGFLGMRQARPNV